MADFLIHWPREKGRFRAPSKVEVTCGVVTRATPAMRWAYGFDWLSVQEKIASLRARAERVEPAGCTSMQYREAKWGEA